MRINKIRVMINKRKYKNELYRVYNLFFSVFKINEIKSCPNPNIYLDDVIMFRFANVKDKRLECDVGFAMDRFSEEYPRIRVRVDFWFNDHVMIEYLLPVAYFNVKTTDEEFLKHFNMIKDKFEEALKVVNPNA